MVCCAEFVKMMASKSWDDDDDNDDVYSSLRISLSLSLSLSGSLSVDPFVHSERFLLASST